MTTLTLIREASGKTCPIHRGNDANDTSRCILPGLSAGRSSVNQSTTALNALVEFQPRVCKIQWRNSK